ncbi:MAG TPA: phosphoglycerate kinase [Candidatus Limnocylindrales bacterium]
MDKLTVRDLEARDKRVFVRVDFNVPLEDGKVTDDSRIRASLPTIVYLMQQGAKVILASHLGRPDGKVQDGLRLRPVGERLSQLLRRNVPVTGDALGAGTEDAVKRVRPGEALLLENLRFHAEEERNDPGFAATLASYAEVYVNDAFGTAHRAHASTVGVPKILPAYAGLLMEREIRALSKLLENPEHPYAAIVGGAKVSGKLKVLDNLLRQIDVLILGGGMANTFLLAQGNSVGKSLAEHDMLDEAKRVLADAEKRGVRVVLPVDVIVAKEVTRGTEYKTLPAAKIPASWHIVDVGRQTLELIETALRDVRTVIWNGPIGVFEIPVFGAGTRHVARILAEKAQAGATVVVGGGDSVAAVQQQGLASQMTHISTGGGASLEFLEGNELPGIAVLLDRPAPEPVAAPVVAEPEPEPAALAAAVRVAGPAAEPTARRVGQAAAKRAAARRAPAGKAAKRPTRPTRPAPKRAPVQPEAKRAASPKRGGAAAKRGSSGSPARSSGSARAAGRKAPAQKASAARKPATARKTSAAGRKPAAAKKPAPAARKSTSRSTAKGAPKGSATKTTTSRTPKSTPRKRTTPAKKPATARKPAARKSAPASSRPAAKSSARGAARTSSKRAGRRSGRR